MTVVVVMSMNQGGGEDRRNVKTDMDSGEEEGGRGQNGTEVRRGT